MANEFLFGVAMGNARRANAASAAADSLAITANFATDELHKAGVYIGTLKDEIATLKRQAQIDDAAIAGMTAQIAALKVEHPNSPLFALTAQVSKKSGKPKSKLALIYEQFFDAALRKVGIVSPASFRGE